MQLQPLCVKLGSLPCYCLACCNKPAHRGNVQLVNEAEARGKLILDKLDCVRTVLDRRESRKRLEHIFIATNGLVGWAPAVLVEGRGGAESNVVAQMKTALQQGDALICKPCVACGIPQSHDMRLVWAAGALPPAVRSYCTILLGALI